ncbi:transglycosylase [Nitrosomonas sp. JL21]|nr:transglycosylase SLT domain-containing protein [Nitrosomonas sp.]MXS78295.1 transglycosylase [Nitrosomonas sp. JL21]
MNDTTNPPKTASEPKKTKPRPKRKHLSRSRSHPDESTLKTRIRKKRSLGFQHKLLLSSIEIFSLGITAVCVIIMLVGYFAERFSGTTFLAHVLPFASGILLLITIISLLLIGWWKLRKWSQPHAELLAPTLSIIVVLSTLWLINHDQFTQAYGHFRTLVGGKAEAGRITVAHQVYAAYRRHDSTQLQTMINRSSEFRSAINDAAQAFKIDVHLLLGIAATESSFIPRSSHDGGRGLFQITRIPEIVLSQARKYLGNEKISLENHRHNAFVAAATFKHYLAEMKNDLFLGLLAYNIGPANGGLRFIMQQYDATDFATIQPYLQTLPRDYPIRVLSYALAFRLWHKEGKLLAYEEGNNAARIQRIGIPGLFTGF